MSWSGWFDRSLYSRIEIGKQSEVLLEETVEIMNNVQDLCKKLQPHESYEFDDMMVNDGLYSALMEYNLLCDRQIIATIISSMTFVAFFIGAGISGMVSDKFGR